MRYLGLLVLFFLLARKAGAAIGPPGGGFFGGKGSSSGSSNKQQPAVVVDDEDVEEDEDDDEGSSLVSKLPLAVGVLGAAGLAVYAGFKLRAHLQARAKEHSGGSGGIGKPKMGASGGLGKKNAPALDPTKSLFQLLTVSNESTALLELDSATKVPTQVDLATLSSNYVVIIFDCDNFLEAEADEKARKDYFALMANLTSAATENSKDKATQMTTIYIPGSGNKNLMEDVSNPSFRPNWRYLSSMKNSPGVGVAAAIRQKYGVRSEELRILVLGPDNQRVISENALDLLRIYPKGMPWEPKPLLDLLHGGKYMAGSGGELSDIDLRNKTVALYFSASWCVPCKKFSPKLVTAYKQSISKVNRTEEEEEKAATVKQHDDVEVLFVSLDQEEEAFDTYRTSLPWPAVPFRDARRALLQMGLAVKSIPALVILDQQGRVITASGVTELTGDEKLERFPWPNDVIDLGNGALVECLQRNVACIVLSETCSTEQKASIREVMSNIAIASKKPLLLPRSPREDLAYCVLETDGMLSEALRSLSGLPTVASLTTSKRPSASQLLLLDLSSEEYVLGPALNLDDTAELKNQILDFSKAYSSYSIKMTPLIMPKQSEVTEP